MRPARQTTWQISLWVVLSTILLTIWLGLASVRHQTDLTPLHHTHHHCQLFSGVSHGLAQQPPAIHASVTETFSEPELAVSRPVRLHFAYLARSPPSA